MSLCGGPDVLVMDNWVHKYGLVSMEGRGSEVFDTVCKRVFKILDLYDRLVRQK